MTPQEPFIYLLLSRVNFSQDLIWRTQVGIIDKYFSFSPFLSSTLWTLPPLSNKLSSCVTRWDPGRDKTSLPFCIQASTHLVGCAWGKRLAWSWPVLTHSQLFPVTEPCRLRKVRVWFPTVRPERAKKKFWAESIRSSLEVRCDLKETYITWMLYVAFVCSRTYVTYTTLTSSPSFCFTLRFLMCIHVSLRGSFVGHRLILLRTKSAHYINT